MAQVETLGEEPDVVTTKRYISYRLENARVQVSSVM